MRGSRLNASDPLKVVIAGGSGLIGRRIARSLLADGHAVAVLTRSPERNGARLPGGAVAIRWSARVDDALVATLDGVDAVVNLAGEAIGPRPWILGRKKTLIDSRLRATEALVEAIRRLPEDHRPRVLVNASGTDVYTGLEAEPATETTPEVGGFLAELGIAWEAAAIAAEELGTRVAFVRTAFVLATEAPLFGLLRLPFRLFVGGRLGSGRQWFSWVHIEDLVGIYRLAIDDERVHGPIIAASPDPIRQGEFARALGRAMRRPAWFPVPALLLRLAMREQATLIVDSRRVAPARAIELGYRHRFPTLDAALIDIEGSARRAP
ncbi:MAG: TIGR01777 family oxidoreductase [Chloroflexota bacterium]